MRHITKAIVGTLAAAGLALGAAAPAQAGPSGRMFCEVESPISAAALNADGTWSFEVFDAQPNLVYRAQVTWSADPSNGGHPNTGVQTDENGYGLTTLPRYWAPDGFLPGYRAADGTFVAVPGRFEVRIGPRAYTLPDYETVRAGKTTCIGVVTE